MLRRLALAAVLIFLASCGGIAPKPLPLVPPTPDPLACTGYPEPRTFLEVQSWWAEPGIAEQMHLHAGTCFPLGQNMSGTSTFNVRVLLHRNPGTLFALSFDIYSGYQQYINIPDQTCGIANDCTYWYTVTVDWSKVPAGWRELRLKPRVLFPRCGPPPCDDDPGATQITSAGWPVQVRGGTSGNRASGKYYVESRGWYEKRGYQNAQVNDYRQFQQPWSGVVNVGIKLNCGCGGDDTPTTFAAAYIDPFFHDPTAANTPLRVWNSSYNGPLAIDTTQLSNGPHRLVLRTTSDQPRNAVPGAISGILAFPFEVSNP